MSKLKLHIPGISGMEISGRLFARGDRIYDRANSFKSEVVHLASWLDHVNAWYSFSLAPKFQ